VPILVFAGKMYIVLKVPIIVFAEKSWYGVGVGHDKVGIYNYVYMGSVVVYSCGLHRDTEYRKDCRGLRYQI